uniref:Proline-rich protein PRCC n=1 Tax=Kalanchoe fedtschenkoi TaxID=63787 RepID=A0A7N0R913_KALFE
MDSLLATYASSDEDDDACLPRQQSPPDPMPHPQPLPPSSSSSSASALFTSLPPPKSSSSSLFGSIPPPKSCIPPNPRAPESQPESSDLTSVSGSGRLFNSLPQPISRVVQTLDQISSGGRGDEDLSLDKRSGLFPSLPAPKFGDSTGKASLDLPAPKKVVQFKPPAINWARGGANDDEDDDEEDEEEKERKKRRELQSSAEAPTVKSFLASIPAPKHSKAVLGALPTSGSGRRSIVDVDVPSLKQQQKLEEATVSAAVDSNAVVVDSQGGYVDAYESVDAGADSSNWYQPGESYGDYGGYENHGGYGQYESNWIDRSGSNLMQETPDVPETMARVMGKRGRSEIPTQIIEVKQDELMKNRPREDQVRATGIAFGPSYQPVSSAKGKPSKLHKRKHQIGSLYFDMKQKETELAERRSRGYLTKAETQAKYGW